MKTFKEFMTEKVVKNKQTLYIACEFQKQQVKTLYDKFPVEDMKEPELDPHMTVFYSPNAEGFDKKEVLIFLKSALKDVEYEGILKKYKVFKDTEDGTSDCLVVEIEVCDELKKIQKVIVNFLKNKVNDLKITYPTWKPHMTIGYYEKGEIPKHEKFEPIKITLKNFFCKFGGSESKQYKL